MVHAPSREVGAVPYGLSSVDIPLFIPEHIRPVPPEQLLPLHGLRVPLRHYPAVKLTLPGAAPEIPPTSHANTNPGGPVVFGLVQGHSQSNPLRETMEQVDLRRVLAPHQHEGGGMARPPAVSTPPT